MEKSQRKRKVTEIENDRFVCFDIHLSNKKYYPFSNFYQEESTTIRIDGIHFHSMEQFIMYMKAVTFQGSVLFGESELFSEIMRHGPLKDATQRLPRKLSGLGSLIPSSHSMIAQMGDMSFSDVIIAYGKNPYVCKRIGRQVPNFDAEVWNNLLLFGSGDHDRSLLTNNKTPILNGIIVPALVIKAQQNKHIFDLLVETGERVIVETSPRDNIWGSGWGATTVMDVGGYPGMNLLGRMWMGVRTKLITNNNVGN